MYIYIDVYKYIYVAKPINLLYFIKFSSGSIIRMKRKPGIVTTWEMKRQKRKIGGDVMARIYHAMDYFSVL